MNILITGVAGLLGSRLADWIVENKPDATVIGVDDLSGGYIENVNENVIFYPLKVEEKELEVPIFSEDDIMLVCQQANCDEEKAKDALAETKGDIAQAILRLTSG